MDDACKSRKKLTAQVAHTINDVLRPRGVAVAIEATHACMTTRGVHKPGVTMVTKCLLGCFQQDSEWRHDFLRLIGTPN